MKILEKIKNKIKKIINGEFTCYVCGETYTKGLSEKKARKQFKEEFPLLEFDPNMPLACDNCFQEINSVVDTKSYTEESEEGLCVYKYDIETGESEKIGEYEFEITFLK